MSADVDHDTEPDPAMAITPMMAFDLLSNRRRRRTLRLIAEHDPRPLPITELAERLAVAETVADCRADVSPMARKRTYVSVYQQHLPTLSAAGAVEVHENADRPDTITATEATAPLADAIGCVEARVGGGE